MQSRITQDPDARAALMFAALFVGIILALGLINIGHHGSSTNIGTESTTTSASDQNTNSAATH